jgi:uncharacterized protein (TIGR02246 family)
LFDAFLLWFIDKLLNLDLPQNRHPPLHGLSLDVLDRLYTQRSMKIILAVVGLGSGLGLLAAVAGLATAQTGSSTGKQSAIQGTAEDEATIRTIVKHWQQSWESFDASVLAEDFTQDADWQNAFGVRIKGGAKIVEFVSKVVKRPGVQGRQTTWSEPTVRFVRPDVALAYRDYSTVGHKALNGQEMPQRNTHSTWVLTKDGGKWRIASQVISDDNGAGAPAK